MAASTADIEALSQELERLTRELDQTNSEKIQSAQYGIVLLHEKQALEQKCEELELLYENSRHELALTQEVTNITFQFLYTQLLIAFEITCSGLSKISN